MQKETLADFFAEYIKDTQEKANVPDRKLFLCRLTMAVAKGINIEESARGVYITSRCLKHLFDKKPAEEFLFILKHLYEIVRYPDKIYLDSREKRGEFCFIKTIGNSEYFCSIEKVRTPVVVSEIQIATVFRLRDDKYIKKYTLLWDWGNGAPHRSALDTPEESTSTPQ